MRRSVTFEVVGLAVFWTSESCISRLLVETTDILEIGEVDRINLAVFADTSQIYVVSNWLLQTIGLRVLRKRNNGNHVVKSDKTNRALERGPIRANLTKIVNVLLFDGVDTVLATKYRLGGCGS